jgi:hypothetical protein
MRGAVIVVSVMHNENLSPAIAAQRLVMTRDWTTEDAHTGLRLRGARHGLPHRRRHGAWLSHLRSPRAMIWPTLRAIEISSMARNTGTQLAHSSSIKLRIFRLIGQKMADGP